MGYLPGQLLAKGLDLVLERSDLLVLQLSAPLELILELLVREAVVVVIMDWGVELSLDVLADVAVIVVDASSLVGLVYECGGLPVAVVLEQADEFLGREFRLSALHSGDEGNRHLKVLSNVFLAEFVHCPERPHVHELHNLFGIFHKSATFAINLKLK